MNSPRPCTVAIPNGDFELRIDVRREELRLVRLMSAGIRFSRGEARAVYSLLRRFLAIERDLAWPAGTTAKQQSAPGAEEGR